MDAGNTERLFLAERAAEWLVTLEADTPEAHNGFRHWLIESPQHVREALAATATRLLLTHLFHERDFDAHMLAARAGSVDEIHGDPQDTHVPQTEPSDAQREYPLDSAKVGRDGEIRTRDLLVFNAGALPGSAAPRLCDAESLAAISSVRS